MCISKALVEAQLRWSVRRTECYAIFYCLKVLEDMSKHAPFHLKTDHKNLVYKLYLKDWNFTVSWVDDQKEH